MTSDSLSDIVDRLVKFERGEMTEEETIEFFQQLADTGIVWDLQGTYQRYLRSFVEAGLVKLPRPFDEMNNENWKKKYLKKDDK